MLTVEKELLIRAMMDYLKIGIDEVEEYLIVWKEAQESKTKVIEELAVELAGSCDRG